MTDQAGIQQIVLQYAQSEWFRQSLLSTLVQIHPRQLSCLEALPWCLDADIKTCIGCGQGHNNTSNEAPSQPSPAALRRPMSAERVHPCSADPRALLRSPALAV